MEKRQLIAEIRLHNETAETAFLNQFEPPQLREYLDHLEAAARKQTRIASWAKNARAVKKAA